MKTLYLVTGAAGYLGGEVCRQIVSRGLQGRALVLPGDKTAKYIPKEIEQYEGDLCDVASLERFFQVEPGVETLGVSFLPQATRDRDMVRARARARNFFTILTS